jgi:hypothetical protein
MSGPAVIIEMAAPERDARLSAALLDACSHAIAGGACALSGGGSDEGSPAVAIVTWQDQRTRVRIEVGLRRADHAEWLSRSLVFRPEDSEVERFRSAGLVVATLVGDVRAGARPAPEPPRADDVGAAARAAPAAPAQPSMPGEAPPTKGPGRGEGAAVALDGALLVGSALDRGAPRLGPALRGTVRVLRPLTVTASLRYAVRPADAAGVDVRWLTVGAGLGVTARPAPSFVLRAYFEGLFELVTASATQPAGDDHRSRALPVARVGADAAWLPSEHVGPALAIEGTAHQGTVVEIHGQPVEREGLLGVTGLIGLRVVP